MKSLSGIGLGISLVFGCLSLALVLEIYYMLFWKKRINVFQRQREETAAAAAAAADDDDDDDEEDKLSSGSSSARECLYMFCCKKVSSLSSCAALNPNQICASVRTQQQLTSSSSSTDNVELKSEDRFLCQTGPPRYLFTIMEETMEDLESDDAAADDDGSGSKPVKKSRKGSTSLNDLLLLSVDEVHTTTPYRTPLSSPSFIIHDFSSSSHSPHHVFNPFLESSSDGEISKIKASPPPKFRFLQAAEEKIYKSKMMEEEHSNKAPTFTQDSFITIVVGDHRTDKAQ